MRCLIAGLGIVAACWVAPLSAQGYPGKPVRMIVPFPPGGATDVVARQISPRLGEALGQPVIVENRIGAGGAIGAEAVAKSPPDGHTLLAAFDSFTSNTLLFKNVSFDPVKDFAPITLVVRGPQVLVVPPQLGIKSFKDFIQLAKSKGTGLNYATAGAGTSSHLSMELFKLTTGIGFTAVHYKGGSPAVNDLLGGRVDMMLSAMSTGLPYLKPGKLVALAVTSVKRSPLVPEVPTVGEFYPGFEAQSWVGILAPAKTPREIVDRLNAELVKVLALPEVKERLENMGYEPVGSTPEAFGGWVRSELSKWERVIRERRITLD